jgi:deazaflavin-dependent oxidoreductase (nitroreductase family)
MWYNRLVALMLRSPLHGLASTNVVLLSYSGRKSGKRYETPVNYVQTDDGRLLITTFAKRTWWRNLGEGKRITARLRGKTREASSSVYQDPADVLRLLDEYLHGVPHLAKYFNVERGEDGRLDAAQIKAAAEGRVMVELQLLD